MLFNIFEFPTSVLSKPPTIPVDFYFGHQKKQRKLMFKGVRRWLIQLGELITMPLCFVHRGFLLRK